MINTRLPLSERLTVMVDPVFMDALGELAAQQRESMSNIVRRALLIALPQQHPQFKRMIDESFDRYLNPEEKTNV